MVIVESFINGLVTGSIFAMFAASFTLIFGVMDIPNLSHAALFAAGAYVFYGAFIQNSLPWPIAIIIALLVVAILSAGIERFLLRPLYERDEHDYIFGVILVTLGIATIFERGYADIFGSQPFYFQFPLFEGRYFEVLGSRITYLETTIFIAAVASFLFLYWLNNYTMTGFGLQAIVQDRELAYMKGVEVDRLFLIAFTLGGVMVAVAGILFGAKFSLTPGMGFDLLIKAFIIVILGGIGNVLGAGIAGYALGMYEAYATVYLSSYYIFASEFAVLILFFLIKAIIISRHSGDHSTLVKQKLKAVLPNRG